MTELRFKLRKAGKCVGYMRFAKVLGCSFMEQQWRGPDEDEWCLNPAYDWQFFDEMCPYVCDDRHGQAVYEGDRVKWWERGYEHDSLSGRVEWCKLYAGWGLHSEHSNMMERMGVEGIDLVIELLPDSEQEGE